MGIFSLFKKKEPAALPVPGGEPDLRHLMPYGDILGDGAIQLSFTLPVEAVPEAKEAAKKYIEKLGLQNVLVANMESMGKGLTYFVVYGHATHYIDFNKIKVPKAEFQKMDFDEVVRYARKHLQRKLIIVGATTGDDAHTVGLDAIMNMKGYMGDYGLERYPCFRVFNLRSQVGHEEMIHQAIKLKADVLLVSKVVSQRGKHLEELQELAKLLKKEKRIKSSLIKIAGGPRLNHGQATKLGFDAGFGPGTFPSEVASFIVQEYLRKTK